MTAFRKSQRGAALIIVLLLAATLSILVMALVAATTQSARRTGGAMLRSELLWRASSAEIIAEAAISEALRIAEQGGPRFTRAHPLFSQQLDIPFADGGGAIIFADASRCFNLNALAEEGGENSAMAEFVILMTTLGAADADAQSVAGAAKDWIDTDTIQEIGGAEDGFYASLPTPYRTGGGPLASVSEMRAMRGVTAELYAAISPFLCALPSGDRAVLNINTLRPEDAPLLTAASGGALDERTATSILEDRPPGGWTNVDQFLALPPFQDDEFDTQSLTSRIAVSPQYIEAIAGATVNDIDMSVRLLFSATNTGNVTLVSRILGSDS